MDNNTQHDLLRIIVERVAEDERRERRARIIRRVLISLVTLVLITGVNYFLRRLNAPTQVIVLVNLVAGYGYGQWLFYDN